MLVDLRCLHRFILIGIFFLRRILQLRQKKSPTETQQIRMHSRLVREAFDELEHKPEREQWIPTWNAEMNLSWAPGSETRTSSRTSIEARAGPDPFHR